MLLRLSIMFMLASAPAFAQHDHAHEGHHEDASAFAASVSLVAAEFDTMLYAGNYQGVVPSLGWSNARYAAMVTGSVYRLEKNGGLGYGAGDVMAHGQVTLVARESLDAGVAFAASAPTGDAREGTGMGHLMLMPAVFGGWRAARVRFAASLGYSRALGNGQHEGHGPWPIVSPMMSSEVSWSAGGEVLITRDVRAGARTSGGIPVGIDGSTRAVIGGRGAWRTGRVDTALELQVGIAGDPFTVRGVVSTALTF